MPKKIFFVAILPIILGLIRPFSGEKASFIILYPYHWDFTLSRLLTDCDRMEFHNNKINPMLPLLTFHVVLLNYLAPSRFPHLCYAVKSFWNQRPPLRFTL